MRTGLHSQGVLALSLVATLLGAVVLGGWWSGIDPLKGAYPGLPPVKPNTAAGLILCGAALVVLSVQGRASYFVSIAGAVVIAAAVVTLSQDLFGWSAGIDERLISGDMASAGVSLRMSPATAFCFILAGLALLAMNSRNVRRRPALSAGLAASVSLISALALVGHLFEALWDIRWANFSGMAPATPLGFLALGGALFGLAHRLRKVDWSLNRTLSAGFAVGIGSMVAATALSFDFTTRLNAESASVAHSQEILKELEEIQSLTSVLESSQRGYLITGSEDLLVGRQEAVRRIQEHLVAVRRLTEDNPDQHRRLDGLEPLISERTAFGNQTIEIRRSSGFGPARALLATGTGIGLTSSINELLRTMKDDEYARLQARQDALHHVSRTTFQFLPLGAFVSLAIVIVGLYLLNARVKEQKRVEAALRDSEATFRGFIEQASDGIFIADAEGNFVVVNSSGCALLGYDASELVGMNGRVTYLEEERQLHVQRLRDVAAGAVLRFERTIRRKDGTTFPGEVSVKRLDSGLVQVIFRDITERKLAQEALSQERALLRALVDALPDLIFIKDKEGRLTLCNAAGYVYSGFKNESEMLGKTAFDLYEPELARQYHADDMLAGSGRSIVNREESGLDVTGRKRWFLTIKLPLRNAAGKPIGTIGVSRDITERRLHEERITRLHRIKEVLSGINSAIVRIRDRKELFEEACRIAAEVGEFSIAVIAVRDKDDNLEPIAWGGMGRTLLDDLPPGARGAPTGVVARAMEGRTTIVDNDIARTPNIDAIRRAALSLGAQSAVALPLYQDDKVVGVFLLYASVKDAFDDEEVKLLEELAGDVSFALTFIEQQEKVDYLAYYDTLTGLPNRSLFHDRLGRQVAAAARGASQVALVMMDVDRFRMINETLGRQAGDSLLKAIAERVKSSVREPDTVARLNADTFAIVASGTWRPEDLAHLMDTRKQELFGQAFVLDGEELILSATAGVAIFPEDGRTPESLLANAEAALRNAKQQSVPFLFYGPEMNARAADSLRIENRLRRAIEKQHLALWYQPKIDSKTGGLKGFEALMRWIDPDTGVVPPGQFIPIMEQTGMILDAGRWALNQVAKDCTGWANIAKVAPRIAVNVSPLQLRQKNFVTEVIDASDAIAQCDGLLDLEITESVIMENVDAIIPKLQTIRGLGVNIYVDDFGTGYSSLAYIARLPIHALKIDRSFVDGMTQSEDSLAIVTSVISLAHSLKLRVVAEGVETEAQRDLLQKLRCDELQGYLFGRPIPAQDVPDLIRKFS
jgi:diguanylate cyclase (GGDEF)-like protein/PAS domain S-box-containing protein